MIVGSQDLIRFRLSPFFNPVVTIARLQRNRRIGGEPFAP